MALTQGLWPPTPLQNIILANGTTITSPLGGYQYVPGPCTVLSVLGDLCRLKLLQSMESTLTTTSLSKGPLTARCVERYITSYPAHWCLDLLEPCSSNLQLYPIPRSHCNSLCILCCTSALCWRPHTQPSECGMSTHLPWLSYTTDIAP